MKQISLIAAFLCSGLVVQAKTLRVLFIGNSYTAVNNLPSQIAQLADGTHDTLIYDMSAPGGYTFQQHTTNTTTLSKIQQGNWDYVVLQEQSQLPSFPDAQVASDVYPYAHALDSIIHENNPCAKTIFYVTWGRKNGDASNCAFFPPVCTYDGMDSLLQLRYSKMAEFNSSAIAPVAMVWHRVRTSAPGIELYDTDESHPSMAGTFVAACAFYSVLFEKSPLESTYTAGLNPGTTALIKTIAEATAYDSLDHWNRFLPVVTADFTSSITNNVVDFTNASQHADQYSWSFGDGQSSISPTPSHTYTASGTYTVTLIASFCDQADTATQTITVTVPPNSINELAEQIGLKVYPVPATTQLFLKYDPSVKISRIALSDISGKMTYRQWNAQQSLNLEGIAPGMYILILDTDRGIVRKKITVK
jgi:hypothetical protein